ncbi:MAG: hypothetical protein WA821_11600 [Anaerolineales bacterium]
MFKNYLRKVDKMKILGRLLGSLLAILLFMFVTPLQITYAAATPPPYTTSWYMDTPNPTWLPNAAYDKGCALGTHDLNTPGAQDNVVILLFGYPAYVNGLFGAMDWDGIGSGTHVFISATQIKTTIQQFARGYWQCTGPGDTTSQLFLAVGTNNDGGKKSVTYAQGRAWAAMVKNINDWVNAIRYASQIKIRAASDMELGLNSAKATRAWVDGYGSAYGSGLWLYDVGDAAGCPYPGNPNAKCGAGAYDDWTSEDVWYISWGKVVAYPIPEIYNTNGATAGEWYYLSLYSYAKPTRTSIYFPGTLTQFQSCAQAGGCAGVNNTPAQGWTQLWNIISSDPRTAQTSQRWSTDMKWHVNP